MPVIGRDGERIAQAVEAMAACGTGRIDYLIISVGGIGGLGEALHQLPWSKVKIQGSTVVTDLDLTTVQHLPSAEPDTA
jgi:hypothetical protein